VFVRDADGRWSPGSHPAGLRKKPWLEGPVQDAFTTPFILVYGTPEDEISRYIIEAEARRFTEDWELLYNAPCRIKSDRDVTEQELADYSLVLYGNKDQNLVYRRMADQLPLQVDSQGVQIGSERWDGADVGAKFCFPSPLNPDRYVCIFAGATWRGTYGINNRFGNWFHWGPFDNYNWFDFVVFDERTVSPPTVLCTGFFDSQWRMSTRWRYDGNEELRGSVAPRNVPVHLRAPGGGRLYLSDLVPASIRQHKGNVNSDRSFRGNPIRLGGARYDRGLGVRAPSNVEYEIGGRFRRFRAVIGIDLEGGTGTDARLKNEYVQFMVWGDGRRLFASPWLQWNMPPVRIQVPVVGVERLRLEVQSGSARWHLGSAAWADACVE
jgi:hypothetical protein